MQFSESRDNSPGEIYHEDGVDGDRPMCLVYSALPDGTRLSIMSRSAQEWTSASSSSFLPLEVPSQGAPPASQVHSMLPEG